MREEEKEKKRKEYVLINYFQLLRLRSCLGSHHRLCCLINPFLFIFPKVYFLLYFSWQNSSILMASPNPQKIIAFFHPLWHCCPSYILPLSLIHSLPNELHTSKQAEQSKAKTNLSISIFCLGSE